VRLKTAWLIFCPLCSTKPNIDQEQFSGDNVYLFFSVPILSAEAHKLSVHLRPNLFHIAGSFIAHAGILRGREQQ